MIKNLIKEKKSINSILRHLVFKNNQIVTSCLKLDDEINNLNKKTMFNIEKIPLINFFNEEFYKGEVNKDGLPHNRGYMVYLGLGDYCGDFENGYRNGKGFMYYRMKDLNLDEIPLYYSGEWMLDVFNGLGTYKFEHKKTKLEIEQLGEFYFNYLNGFGRSILAEDGFNKSKESDETKNNTKNSKILSGYFLHGLPINFYISIQMDSKFNISGKSGLCFVDQDGETVFLHEFEKIEEYKKIEDTITDKDEKMPNEFLDFYHNYFNHEIKTNKFKELFSKIRSKSINLQFYIKKYLTDETFSKFRNLTSELAKKLELADSIKKLKEIEKNLEEINVQAEKLNKLK